jgi:RHS repeat-associated protein
LEYNAFGALINATGDKPLFRYTGKMFDDATALQWNINRWYDSNVGRWISEDTIGFIAGDINIYKYCFNNPAPYTDLLGMAVVIPALPWLCQFLWIGGRWLLQRFATQQAAELAIAAALAAAATQVAIQVAKIEYDIKEKEDGRGKCFPCVPLAGSWIAKMIHYPKTPTSHAHGIYPASLGHIHYDVVNQMPHPDCSCGLRDGGGDAVTGGVTVPPPPVFYPIGTQIGGGGPMP